MSKEKTIVAECCEKVSHHELQAARAEQERKILQEELWRQQKDFREVHQQNLTEMKELQKFQNSTFDEFTRQKFIEDQKTIMELSGRLQELQNEVKCVNDSKDFQDAEWVRTRHQSTDDYSLNKILLKDYWGLHSYRRDAQMGRQIFGMHPVYQETFLHIHRLLQELNPLWKKIIEEPLHMSTAEKSERPERNQDLRCQSGPSAKDSVIFSEGDYSKNYGADQQRLQISDHHFDKFLTPGDAMDQGSGVGWFSGWIEIFVIYSWYFNAEFWSTWCENCFSAEQNHP